MAPDESHGLRELRRLAKKCGIVFKQRDDTWPAVHKVLFGDIRKLGDKKFDDYSHYISIRSTAEPWTRETKTRASWLASRAGQLSTNVQPNESGWRMELENHVLLRFRVEIACPTCRGRLWRSTIEASYEQAGNCWSDELEWRRRHRQPCQCPPELRPQDYYEMGTTRIFDDRVEESVALDNIHTDLPKKKKPDHVVGLKKTRNFEKILSLPLRGQSSTSDGRADRRIETSPFDPTLTPNPPLFPFLVLEAKSESSQNGFVDIQTQSAFPIRRLLQLQDDLRNQASRQHAATTFHPLVWFLGNRGSEWKLYACYINPQTEQPPVRYDIQPLWSGDLATKDGALQLILILDYIADWARDVYRPSILEQMKSLAEIIEDVDVEIDRDSDIYSMRRRIADWIPGPPTIPDSGSALDIVSSDASTPLDHSTALSMKLPNTTLGLVRSASLVDFHFVALTITDENAELFLKSRGHVDSLPRIRRNARDLVNFITGWDELLVVHQDDLDQIECIWAGEEGTQASAPSEVEHFVVFEYRCFMDLSWNIIRELSCVAISKPALRIIEQYAAFQKHHPGIENFQEILRPCPGPILHEAVRCLRGGSPWQILLSSISSTLMSLSPEPKRKRSDLTPAVEVVSLGYLQRPRIRYMIADCVRSAERQALRQKSTIKLPRAVREKTDNRWPISQLDTVLEGWATWQPTFLRMSRRRAYILSEPSHNQSDCPRCSKSGRTALSMKNFGTCEIPLSAYGAVLVVSLQEALPKRSQKEQHDFCLFIVQDDFKEYANSVSTVVEDLAQGKLIYHTIRHDPTTGDLSRGNWSVVWNLPSPYRPCTKREHLDLGRWIKELAKEPLPEVSIPKHWMKLWDHLQILLYFLSCGMPFDSAEVAVKEFRDKERVRKREYRQRTGFQTETEVVTAADLWRERRLDRQNEEEWNSSWIPPKQMLAGAESQLAVYEKWRRV